MSEERPGIFSSVAGIGCALLIVAICATPFIWVVKQADKIELDMSPTAALYVALVWAFAMALNKRMQ